MSPVRARPGRRPGDSSTREEIARAAREQFAAGGYDRVTLRAVAAQAGVDAALVAYFFGSKRELFDEVVNPFSDSSALMARLLDGDRRLVGERLARLVIEALGDALVVTERVLKLPFPRRRHAIDWLGAFFIVAGISALLLMLSLGGKEFAWNSAWTYGLTAVAVVMLALTVWQERRAAEPIIPPRLFANHTFVITSLAGFVVGVAMFGAIIFLPQYLQIVKGESPTASGLLTLPLMVGLLATSIGSGRLITRTGRYKIFPVVGLLVAAVGLTLMSRLSVDTSLWLAGVFMFITGAGIGMVMQVLVLATQNAVPHADLGVATSGATFFGSLGGAMGVAVFGTLLTHRLRDTIPAQLTAAGVSADQMPAGSATQGSPEQIAALPEPIHFAVTTGFAEALQTTFLAAVPFAILGFVILLFLRETPLRETRGHGSGEDLAAAFETSVDPDGHLTNEEDGPRPENAPPPGKPPHRR